MTNRIISRINNRVDFVGVVLFLSLKTRGLKLVAGI